MSSSLQPSLLSRSNQRTLTSRESRSSLDFAIDLAAVPGKRLYVIANPGEKRRRVAHLQAGCIGDWMSEGLAKRNDLQHKEAEYSLELVYKS